MSEPPIAVVTGATSGIGLSTARHLVEQGWTVYAGYRKEEDGERLAAMGLPRLVPLEMDVTDPDNLHTAAGRLGNELPAGKLDALVNNAGIALAGPMEYLPVAELRRQFEVNVFGLVQITQLLMPFLRSARGRIVNIGSVSGILPIPLMGPYSGSKFALEAISEAWRMELAPWGMPVVLVDPGAVKTAIWNKGRSWADSLETDLPGAAQSRYGRMMHRLRELTYESEKRGVPPEAVAKAVHQALTARRPHTRYFVGQVLLQRIIARYVPSSFRHRLLRRMLRE